jgi:hypothetical protein
MGSSSQNFKQTNIGLYRGERLKIVKSQLYDCKQILLFERFHDGIIIRE